MAVVQSAGFVEALDCHLRDTVWCCPVLFHDHVEVWGMAAFLQGACPEAQGPVKGENVILSAPAQLHLSAGVGG